MKVLERLKDIGSKILTGFAARFLFGRSSDKIRSKDAVRNK